MEPIFENRFYCSKTILKEFYRKVIFKCIPILCVTETVILCCFVVHGLFFGIFLEMIPMYLMMAAVFSIGWLMPDWFVWNIMRQTKKQYDGEIPETTVTFGDTIELHEGMVHYTIPYQKIVRVIHLEHSYVLMIGKKNGIILAPDGFTEGTFGEFKEFLRRKRPDVLIPE